MTTYADAPARARIAEDLGVTLVVEAAAGTGKTTALVGRILALVVRGETTLARIVAVTFTEKAAGEMKLRLRTEIERRREGATSAEVRGRLERALEELEAAHIGTIHGFCADVLRARPVEAEVDPLFEVAAEDEKDRLYEEVFEAWFQATLERPPEGVRRILRRRGRDRDGSGTARRLLRSAGAALVEQRDFDAAWTRAPLSREARIDAVVAQLRELAALASKAGDPEDWLAKNVREVARAMDDLDRTGGDHDYVEGVLRDLQRPRVAPRIWTYMGRGRFYGEGLPIQKVRAMRDAAKASLDALLEDCEADLAALLREELRPLVHRYEERKRRAGKLDFLDLLLRARDLLRTDRAVRNELQGRFTHLLVDEFQDTDPLQAEILLLLGADDPAERDGGRARPVPGKLFFVGDPKQSIYRFRRADVALYERIKRRLVAAGAEVLHLTTSFRAVPSIQHAINAAFEERMRPNDEGSQAEYVALTPSREEAEGRPTIVALPVPHPYSPWDRWPKVTSRAVEESTPDAVGAFVAWLVNESGWGFQAKDVCLLFKRFQSFGRDVTRPYARALEAHRVPHVLMGGRSFHAREEIVAVRNLALAIEWPDDELSVFATLRGPFLALSDEALLAFRHAPGGRPPRALHPMRKVDPATLTELTRPVGEALALLGELHRGRNRRPIADTLARFLEAVRAHAGIASWPSGEQSLGNVLRVLDLARRFEAQGASSFRAFVRRLDDEASRGGVAEAPVVEEGTDGVRIMTVHKAKGLEFKVVVLVDPTAPATNEEPSRWIDPRGALWAMPLAGCKPRELLVHRDEVLRHDAEEAVRLAYVAATRARELLVVPVVGDERVAGWVDVLHDAIYPSDWRGSDAAPGCPPFGEDSVRDRPEGANRGPEDSVRPGLHAPARGEHRVVWWDPRILDIAREEDVGLRQQRILSADAGGRAAQGELAHASWKQWRDEAQRRGAVPSAIVRTVTALKEGGLAAVPAVDVARVRTDVAREARPRGTRFGTLVHATLAVVSLDASADEVRRVAASQAPAVGATPAEIEAAATAVVAALAHDLMRAARAASQCRRECPVTVRAPDGTFVEGVLDLAYREEAGWVIVDFKTDVDLEPRLDDYRRQLALYVAAVAAATATPARAVLFSV